MSNNSEIVKNNSDFIFLYDAQETNPNGDPDMENKPRMDYDTKTNLVSKFRKKRDIRDYVKSLGNKIFIDTEEERKVSVEQKLNIELNNFLNNKDNNFSELEIWSEIQEHLDNDIKNKSLPEVYQELKKIANLKASDVKKDNSKKFINENFKRFNNELLTHMIKKELYDIRLFGSAFAVEGFTKTFTGPVQINWGHSMHPVELMKSSSLVTIMNDDSSTFGKDYAVHYSLIAFNGTISKNLAPKTGLTEEDLNIFRDAIIKSTGSNRSASKGNIRPLAYLEIKYKDSHNGFLGDLRNYIEFDSSKSADTIRTRKDVVLDTSKLEAILKKDQVNNIIDKIIIWESPLLDEKELLFKDFSLKVKDENNKEKEIELVDREQLKEII